MGFRVRFGIMDEAGYTVSLKGGLRMTMLIVAALVFIGIHLLISGTRLRDAIVAVIGARPYLALFALASIAAIVWLCISYNRAQAGDADPVLYDLGRGVHDLAIPVVLIAFLIAVPGLLAPSPTSVRGQMTGAMPDTARGVIAITRHPFLMGVAIWSAFHLAANGDEASVIFFGSFFVLAAVGPASIDAKRRRKMGAQWESFAAHTSIVPFAAAISGRAHLNWREILDWRMAVALLLFLILLFAHPHLFGVSPFPGGGTPV